MNENLEQTAQVHTLSYARPRSDRRKWQARIQVVYFSGLIALVLIGFINMFVDVSIRSRNWIVTFERAGAYVAGSVDSLPDAYSIRRSRGLSSPILWPERGIAPIRIDVYPIWLLAIPWMLSSRLALYFVFRQGVRDKRNLHDLGSA